MFLGKPSDIIWTTWTGWMKRRKREPNWSSTTWKRCESWKICWQPKPFPRIKEGKIVSLLKLNNVVIKAKFYFNSSSATAMSLSTWKWSTRSIGTSASLRRTYWRTPSTSSDTGESTTTTSSEKRSIPSLGWNMQKVQNHKGSST